MLKATVKSAEEITKPMRHHTNCTHAYCAICLNDLTYLGLYIGLKCSGSLLIDWLGEYRQWLDNNNIPAEGNGGWASSQAFQIENIEAFVNNWNIQGARRTK